MTGGSRLAVQSVQHVGVHPINAPRPSRKRDLQEQSRMHRGDRGITIRLINEQSAVNYIIV